MNTLESPHTPFRERQGFLFQARGFIGATEQAQMPSGSEKHPRFRGHFLGQALEQPVRFIVHVTCLK